MTKPKTHSSRSYISRDFIRLLITAVIVSIFIFFMRASEQHYRIVEHWFSAPSASPLPTVLEASPEVTPESEN